MTKRSNHVPPKYEQPDSDFLSRKLLDDELEEVFYIPKTHLRLWYNTQLDNYPLHHHDALELIICMESNYHVICNGTSYMLNVGDILFIPPHALHELNCTLSGSRFIGLFNLEMLQNFQDYKFIQTVLTDSFLCNATSHPEIYDKIYSLLMNLVDIYFSHLPLWEFTVYSLLLQVFACIGSNAYFSHTSNINNSNKTVEDHRKKISAFLNYIDSHYTENISLEQAASYIGFSKYHFSRLFRQYTGSTFYEYLCKKRILAAQALLSSRQSIIEIALQTGFNNPTSFCRCFRKLVGCSPTEYRKYLEK